MKRNRFLLLLVLLLTAVTGTWAQQQQLKVKEITVEMATPWLDDDGSTVLSESHLPTFYPVTEEEAMAWAEVPTEGTVFLIYSFDEEDEGTDVQYVMFQEGNYVSSYDQEEYIQTLAVPLTEQGIKFYYTWAETHTVTLDDSGKDTDNWEITPKKATTTGVKEGQTVTLKYSGDREVKSITATLVKPSL
jgi:hypothetical protein